MLDLTRENSRDLAATLLGIAAERGITMERFRAEQLLAEARQAWPGDRETMWSKWLVESAKSLGLRSRIAEISLRQALDLVQDGALLVCAPNAGSGEKLVVAFDGRLVDVMDTKSSQRERLKPLDLASHAALADERERVSLDTRCQWVVVEDVGLHHDVTSVFHGRPILRLLAIVKPEYSDIWVVAVFAFFAGVLSLATPIAVESLVNIVSFGRLIQPLVILSLMLFGFLAFASLMRALQTFVVEIVQRRLFARVAADLAYRFPRVDPQSLHGHYGPELANRFFDVVTLQKVTASLLLDGLAIVLATAVGMAVLAFYHPWLLGFDLLLLVTVVSGVLVLGRGAINTGIDESRQKYRLAAWLEDLIRCPVSFKLAGASEFALDRANQITADYLNARRRHFHVLFRQLLFILGLQAVAGTVLLGFGGWLVIRGQLTLGQLVAAELIVATILASLAKLGKHIEAFYDVVASVDKLGHLFDLEIEPQDGLVGFRPDQGACLKITDVRHALGGPWPRQGFSLDIEASERVAFLGRDGATSTILFDMLYGLRFPDAGHIEIEQSDPRDLRPDVLRTAVTLARGIEVFEGTIAENVQMARPGVSMTDVRSALHAVGLLDDVLRFPDGLDTPLNAGGEPLSAAQLTLLMLARAIAGAPQLLLIDDLLDSLGDEPLREVCNALRDSSREWTLLVSTKRREIAELFDRVIEMEPKLISTVQPPALPYSEPIP